MPWTEYVRFTQDYNTSGISNVSNLLGSNTGTVTFSDAGDQTVLTTPNLSGLIPEYTRITGVRIRLKLNVTTSVTTPIYLQLQKWNGTNYSSVPQSGENIVGLSTNATSPATIELPTNSTSAITNIEGNEYTRDDLDDLALSIYYIDSPDNNFVIYGESTTPYPAIKIYYEAPTVTINTGKVVLGSGKTQIR